MTTFPPTNNKEMNLEFATKEILREPNPNADRLLALANLCVVERKASLAKDLLARYLAMSPTNADALRLFGDVKEQFGDLDAAKKYWRLSLDANAQQPQLRDKLAQASLLSPLTPKTQRHGSPRVALGPNAAAQSSPSPSVPPPRLSLSRMATSSSNISNNTATTATVTTKSSSSSMSPQELEQLVANGQRTHAAQLILAQINAAYAASASATALPAASTMELHATYFALLVGGDERLQRLALDHCLQFGEQPSYVDSLDWWKLTKQQTSIIATLGTNSHLCIAVCVVPHRRFCFPKMLRCCVLDNDVSR
jgi:hypothetical protein